MTRMLLLSSAALAALLLPAGARAAGSDGGWIGECSYSHSLTDDPIKFPGQPGASHLHDFFGASTTNAGSTYSGLATGRTSCGNMATDTAAYWVPALFKSGARVLPAGAFKGRNTREKFYYRGDHNAAGTHFEPFPPNFKMIQGYGDATSVADANAHGAGWGRTAWWGCSDNSVGGKSSVPVACKDGIITVHLTFPNCWDGVTVPGDEVAAGHVKFPDSQACPAGFKHVLPMVIYRLEYPVGAFQGSVAGITLSSGAFYTFHGDLWNTWHQTVLSSLTTRCLNAGVDCGTDPK